MEKPRKRSIWSSVNINIEQLKIELHISRDDMLNKILDTKCNISELAINRHNKDKKRINLGKGRLRGGSLPLPAGRSSASCAFRIDISNSTLPYVHRKAHVNNNEFDGAKCCSSISFQIFIYNYSRFDSLEDLEISGLLWYITA
jgi:hypothetical protein